MSEVDKHTIRRWPLVPSESADWLRELCGDGLTGFMPPAMPDAAWVLNAMYELDRGPIEATYEESHQAHRTDGTTGPWVVGDIDLDAIGVVTGGSLGRAEHPGPGWSRLPLGGARAAHRRPGGARGDAPLPPLLPLGHAGGQLAPQHHTAHRGEHGS